MKKNYKLDNIRTFAILTVVIGHSIILYSSQWNLYEPSRTSDVLDLIKRVINLYQMPLFFLFVRLSVYHDMEGQNILGICAE